MPRFLIFNLIIQITTFSFSLSLTHISKKLQNSQSGEQCTEYLL